MNPIWICSLIVLIVGSEAFVPSLRTVHTHTPLSFVKQSTAITSQPQIPLQFTKLKSSTEVESTSLSAQEEDDDDEYEYEEYESLTEADFYNSEWKIGTLWDNSNNIEETWFRCVVKEGDFGAVEFIAVWGDGSKGKWNFDAASQFFSISKDSYGGWFGKKIWAGSVDDFYYMQGTIRGWNPISPASVLGQWQAKRLGVDREEAGVAPWFQTEEDENEQEADEVLKEEASSPGFASEEDEQ
jgi:hypothetical protein